MNSLVKQPAGKVIDTHSAAPHQDPKYDGQLLPDSAVLFSSPRWPLPNYNPSISASARTIIWDTKLENGDTFLHPKYEKLLWACKCYIWASLHPRGQNTHAKSGSIIAEWLRLKVLIRWMVKNGFYSFSDLSFESITDFVDYVRGRKNKSTYKANIIDIVVKVFGQRDRMPDSNKIDFHPLRGLTPGFLIGWRNLQKQEIPPIPDDFAKSLLQEAERWLLTYSEDILTLSEAVEKERAARVRKERKHIREGLRPVIRDFSFSPETRNNPRIASLRTVDDLYAVQRDLISAVSITVLMMVGPRISEFSSFTTAPLRGPVISDDETLEIFYIQGITQKRSTVARGHEREWVAAARPAGSDETPLVMRAINIARRLAKIRGVRSKRLHFGPRTKTTPARGPIMDSFRKFAEQVPGGDQWRPRSHAFRKTYARFVGRHDPSWTTGPLMQQFGHVSVAHAMAYTGNDPDLNALIEEVKAEEISAALMELVTAPALAGKTGVKLLAPLTRLRATIAKPDEFVAILKRLALNENIQIHLAPWGACYFRAYNNPNCHGVKGPNYALRSEEICCDCENLGGGPKYAPFHENRIREYRHLLELYPNAVSSVRDDWLKRIASSESILASLSPNFPSPSDDTSK